MISIRYIVDSYCYVMKAHRVPMSGEVVIFNADRDDGWALKIENISHCYAENDVLPWVEAHCERTDLPHRATYIEVKPTP